jgi:hypothetical protein
VEAEEEARAERSFSPYIQILVEILYSRERSSRTKSFEW